MKSLQGNGADDGGKEGSDAGGAEQTHTHTHTVHIRRRWCLMEVGAAAAAAFIGPVTLRTIRLGSTGGN